MSSALRLAIHNYSGHFAYRIVVFLQPSLRAARHVVIELLQQCCITT